MSIAEVDRTDYPSIGPRVTPEAIEANIASEHYFTAWQGASLETSDVAYAKGRDGKAERDALPDCLNLLTICVMVLQNGFTVTGESACADPRNFNKEIGQRVARQNAINKIWPLMGYELRTRINDMKYNVVDNRLGEALTMMMAHRLGNPDAFKPEDAEAILAHFDGRARKENGAS
jgi:hypothetical protein